MFNQARKCSQKQVTQTGTTVLLFLKLVRSYLVSKYYCGQPLQQQHVCWKEDSIFVAEMMQEPVFDHARPLGFLIYRWPELNHHGEELSRD